MNRLLTTSPSSSKGKSTIVPATTSRKLKSAIAAASSPSETSISTNSKKKVAFQIPLSPTIQKFSCTICLETCRHDLTTAHNTGKCTHNICRGCIRSLFDAKSFKLNNSADTMGKKACIYPKCKQKYTIDDDFLCEFFTRKEVEQWWIVVLQNSSIQNKVKCPFENCTGVFDVEPKCTSECTFCECYECHRGFCVACQKKWHPGEKKIFNDVEEIKNLLKQAEGLSWTRCPKCHNLTEKIAGCHFVKCICGCSFCYRCGTATTLHLPHGCRKCQNLDNTSVADIRRPMFLSATVNNTLHHF